MHFSSPLPNNLSTLLGSIIALLQIRVFVYYYEWFLPICIISSLNMEVNVITSSFDALQYVELIKCH